MVETKPQVSIYVFELEFFFVSHILLFFKFQQGVHLKITFADAFEKEIRKLHKSGFELLAGTPVHELSSPMRSYPTRHVSPGFECLIYSIIIVHSIPTFLYCQNIIGLMFNCFRLFMF